MTVMPKLLKNNLKERTQNHDVDCLCPDCNTFDDLDDSIQKPKEWIGLDPKDIYDAYQEVKGQYRWVERFASAIEAKLKEKNT